MAELMARASSRSSGCACSGSRSRTAARTCSATRAGRRRRADADVQRPHGHVVLGPRALARAASPASSRRAFVRDGRLYGLGISNMKGALAATSRRCARSATQARCAATCMIAAVARRDREDAVGRRAGRGVPRLRGRLAPPRRRTAASPDMCILGEPTEQKLVLGHFGSLWLRLTTHGPRSSTRRSRRAGARRTRSCACARCSTRARVAAGAGRRRCPTATCAAWRTSARSRAASAGASRGRRTGPTSSSTCACRPTSRWRRRGARRSSSRRGARTGVEAEVYVTAPGAEIDEAHPLVGALDEAHEEVFGAAPGARRDALVLGRVGAHALRDRDRQLRHLVRAAGPGVRREPRDRRARARSPRSTRARRRGSAESHERGLDDRTASRGRQRRRPRAASTVRRHRRGVRRSYTTTVAEDDDQRSRDRVEASRARRRGGFDHAGRLLRRHATGVRRPASFGAPRVPEGCCSCITFRVDVAGAMRRSVRPWIADATTRSDAGQLGLRRRGMKLVTFGEGRVGRLDGDEIAVLDVPTMRE